MILSPDGRPVYNCCQSVVSIFAQDVGYDEDACMKAATYFRGGMQMGSVCGAITGGLMALGLAGIDDNQVLNEFYRKIRENHDGIVKGAGYGAQSSSNIISAVTPSLDAS